eukprot:g6235.t1
MKFLKISKFVHGEIATVSTALSLVHYAHAKRTHKTTRIPVRGIGKSSIDSHHRTETFPNRFQTRRSLIRLSSFGQKPAQQSHRVTRVNEEHLPSVDEKEKLGSNIPWGKRKIIEVMTLWFFAFLTFRSCIWRLGLWVLG